MSNEVLLPGVVTPEYLKERFAELCGVGTWWVDMRIVAGDVHFTVTDEMIDEKTQRRALLQLRHEIADRYGSGAKLLGKRCPCCGQRQLP